MNETNSWVFKTRDQLLSNGWVCIPWCEDQGEFKPVKFGNNEQYSAKHPAWKSHPLPDHFSIRLDGAILLDLDYNKNGATLTPADVVSLFGDLGTPHQWRESDNSTHFLFRLPDGIDPETLKQSADRQIHPNIDIKRANQLCHIKRDKMFPHGTIPNVNSLPVAPAAVIEALTIKEVRRTPLAELQFTNETTPYGSKALADACAIIVDAPEGCRNSTFNTQTMRIFQLVAGGSISEDDAEICLLNAAECTGMDTAEIDATYASARKKGITEPRSPAVASPDDFSIIPEEIEATLASDNVTEFKSRFPLMASPGGQVSAVANDYCVRGVLPAKGIGLIVGKSSAGKTFAALSIAASIASGRGHWGGRFCATGSVVYIAGEPGSGLRHRLRALSTEWNNGNAFNNLFIIERGINLSEPIKNANGIDTASDIYELFKLIAHINKTHPDNPVRMVVADTVSQTMNGDQNSRQDVSGYLANYANIANQFNCCVMGIHHVGKDAARGATGSAAWRDNVDFMINLNRGIGERVVLTYDKLRDGEEQPETFNLKIVKFEQEFIDQAEAAFSIEQAERPEINLPRYEINRRMNSYSTLVFDDSPCSFHDGPAIPQMPYFPDPEAATSREKLVGALLRLHGGRAPEKVLRDEFNEWVKCLVQAKPSWVWAKAIDRLLAENSQGKSQVSIFKEGETSMMAFAGFEAANDDFADLSSEFV